MNRIATSFLSLSLTLSSLTAYSQTTTEMSVSSLKVELTKQKTELSEAQNQLRQAKASRAGWVVATVASGAVSLITALPGVVSTVGGVQNVMNGQPWLGDPDNGGPIMIPVIIVSTVVSAATGYAAAKSYTNVELRTQDIEKLIKKIDDKKAAVDVAQEAIDMAEKSLMGTEPALNP